MPDVTALESVSMRLAASMKVTGLKTKGTVRGTKDSAMVTNTSAIIQRDVSVERVSTPGQTVIPMTVNGSMVSNTATVCGKA